MAPKKPATAVAARPPPATSTSKSSSSSSSAVPKNWPTNLSYLSRPYTTSIPSSLLSSLNLTPHPPSSSSSSSSSLIRIRPITLASHPAYGQSGLFATRRLAPKSFILPYFGRYHTSSTTDPASDYDIWLDRELDVAVDAGIMGNEGRFVNDFRGVRESGANVEFRVVGGGGGGGLRVEIWTLKEVAKGEELCVSYGKGFWEGRKAEGGGLGSEGGEEEVVEKRTATAANTNTKQETKKETKKPEKNKKEKKKKKKK